MTFSKLFGQVEGGCPKLFSSLVHDHDFILGLLAHPVLSQSFRVLFVRQLLEALDCVG